MLLLREFATKKLPLLSMRGPKAPLPGIRVLTTPLGVTLSIELSLKFAT